MNLFFSRDIQNDSAYLDPEESRHLAKVLRMNSGDKAELIDGAGNWLECEVLVAHPKKSSLKILSRKNKAINYGIQMAIAPTKNLNRWEWFLEKATELGIDRISPILSEHSERKVLKRERQERILISAMKQSYKAQIPQLDEMEPFKKFIAGCEAEEKFIAHCEEDMARNSLKSLHEAGKTCCILIGPEGDFSPAEIALAKEAGFREISLGESRLRTETAAFVALQSIHLLNE